MKKINKLQATITEELNDVYFTNDRGSEERITLFRLDDTTYPSGSKWYSPLYIHSDFNRHLGINHRYQFHYLHMYIKKIRHSIYQYPKEPNFINVFSKIQILFLDKITRIDGSDIVKTEDEDKEINQEIDYYENIQKMFNKKYNLGSEL